jgi:hypothetical protein
MTPRQMLYFIITGIALGVWGGFFDWALRFMVDFANFALFFAGEESFFSVNTADWRAQIWIQSIEILMSTGNLLWGDLPGQNFLRNIFVPGAGDLATNQLGVNRSTHNIVIQIITKTGLIGFSVWFLYYIHLIRQQPRVLWFYHALFFAIGLSSDFFEVPSRAAVWFTISNFLAVIWTQHHHHNRQKDSI